MSDKNKEHPDAPRRRFYVYFSTFIGAMAGLAYSSTIVGQPLPRAMAFVFVVLMIMVVVAGPLSSSWMG